MSALAESVLGRKIDLQIGEFNSDHKDDDGHRTQTHFNTLWGAAALGRKSCTRAPPYQYGDKRAAFGLTSEKGEGGIPRNEPLPIYHGIGMYTGEGLFRPFGKTIVQASANNDKLHVFASDQSKNIVLVNVGADPIEAGLALTGLTAGTAAIWQSTSDAWTPHRTGTTAIAGGKATVTLPAGSATTLVIDQQGLSATYFDNADLTGADVNQDRPHRELRPGALRVRTPAIGADTFSVRWTGKVLSPTASGDPTPFSHHQRRRVKLWVDGKCSSITGPRRDEQARSR